MYITPIIIGKISHDMSCLALKGLISYNNRRCSIHYPAYYTPTCQNEKITLHGVSFYNYHRCVDRQRNSLP